MRKWLTFETNLSYADYESNGIISGLGANRAGVVLSVINTPQYAPIWSTKAGEEGWYYYDFKGANLSHPVENISRRADNLLKNNRFVGSGSAIVQLMDGLRYKSTFAIDRLSSKRKTVGQTLNSLPTDVETMEKQPISEKTTR